MNAVKISKIREMIQVAWRDSRMLESGDFVLQTPFDDVGWLVGVRPLDINYVIENFFSEDPFSILDPAAAIELLGSYFLMILDVVGRGSKHVPSELGIPFYSVSKFLEEKLTNDLIRDLEKTRLGATREVLKCLIESQIRRINRERLTGVLHVIDEKGGNQQG